MRFQRTLVMLFCISILFLLTAQTCATGSRDDLVAGTRIGRHNGLVASFEHFGVSNDIHEDEASPVVVLLQNKG
jgi:hypothetical protein